MGGLRGFWMGNGLNCIKIAPEMGIKLVAFDAIKDRVAADPDKATTVERFVAGGVAGALARAAVYPLDVLKTRMATGVYGSFACCVSSVMGNGRSGASRGVSGASGGIGALYAGLI